MFSANLELISFNSKQENDNLPITAAVDINQKNIKIKYLLNQHFSYKYLADQSKNSAITKQVNLWEQEICFEFFIKHDTEYYEFNFHPSNQYRIYHFSDYRSNQKIHNMSQKPKMILNQDSFDVSFINPFAKLSPNNKLKIQIATIFKNKYFALKHNPAKPDFHDCKYYLVINI